MVINLKSAEEFAEVIDRKLAKELALGRIIGPYDVPPTCLRYRISPLGVVPKKSPGEFICSLFLSSSGPAVVREAFLTYADVLIARLLCARQVDIYN